MTALQARLPSKAGRPPGAGAIALLVEPSVEVCASVLGTLEAHGYEVRVARDLAEELDGATLVLVEADRGARALGLIRRVQALRPDLPLACVLGWWDDDEGEACRLCRFILHVPVREDQLQGLAEFASSVLGRAALT